MIVITIGDKTTEYELETPNQDVEPDAFDFTDISNVNPDTTTTSGALILTGYDYPLPASVTGHPYDDLLPVTDNFTLSVVTDYTHQTSGYTFTVPEGISRLKIQTWGAGGGGGGSGYIGGIEDGVYIRGNGFTPAGTNKPNYPGGSIGYGGSIKNHGYNGYAVIIPIE
ncbi:MAG: hypothetical protein U9N14_01405 [Pseudomonadota bacterium]|nr:hypothetical protein [Pseudomonadota bacterium]